MSTVILSIGGLYFLAKVFGLVFERYKIPDVLLLTSLGLLLGPIFNVLEPEAFGKAGSVLTTIALVIILFESGLNTRFRDFVRSFASSAPLTLLTALVTFLLGAFVVFTLSRLSFLGFDRPWTFLESLLLGAIISGTSSAVVIPLLNYLKTDETLKGALNLESALTDVICIVAAFALLALIKNPNDLDFKTLGLQVFNSFFLAGVIGAVASVFWIWVWKRIVAAKSSLLTTVAFTFVVYGAAEALGVSGAIAVLIFGLGLNNYELLPANWLSKIGDFLPKVTTAERSLYAELVFVLKIFFFVFLGINIPLQSFEPHFVAALILVPIYAARYFTVHFLYREKLSSSDRWIAFSMIPKGLAAAVLAGIPTQLGFDFGVALEEIVYAIVIQSIFATSLLVFWGNAKSAPT